MVEITLPRVLLLAWAAEELRRGVEELQREREEREEEDGEDELPF